MMDILGLGRPMERVRAGLLLLMAGKWHGRVTLEGSDLSPFLHAHFPHRFGSIWCLRLLNADRRYGALTGQCSGPSSQIQFSSIIVGKNSSWSDPMTALWERGFCHLSFSSAPQLADMTCARAGYCRGTTV